MNLRFHWKMWTDFILLGFSLLVVQAYFRFSLSLSWFLSSFLALLFAAIVAYFLLKNLGYPVQRMAEVVRGLTGNPPAKGVYPGNELENLSRLIDEIANQFRKKILEAAEDKEYLQTILRGMMEGVLVVDEKMRIKTMNEALRALLRVSSDLKDKTPLEVIRNADLEAALRRAFRGETCEAFEMDVPAAGGKTLEVNVVSISSAEKDSSGKIMGAIAVFHDITRLKRLEKIRQDFVANVSHELRTPLTTIKGYAETLLEGALKEEVASQFIRVIDRHADRLTKIVEDLLALSKIESKEFTPKPERLPISEWINGALDLVRGEADKNGVSISWSAPPSLPFIFGDRKGLEQVLSNLLDNAIKYGREGGKINIIATEDADGEIQISVQDDGIGIPNEDLPRIFERFYRVDKGRSKELGGTGLGLSIVKHVVQAHGGRVWAESQIGKGSTFFFTLPVPKDRIAQRRSAKTI
jgi:two-component system, OmpR family, phosphate regulon sensor histidine kinase PhoR